MEHNAYRNGRIHLCAAECSTCVFRPGNLMHLGPGRLREMIDSARVEDSAIICHKTLDGDNAVCRGFFDRYQTTPLLLAERLRLLVEINPEGGDPTPTSACP